MTLIAYVSSWGHFCEISSSIRAKLTLKMSLLVICGIPSHFANTLRSGDKYSLRNSENFLQPIEMALSKKWIIFSESLSPFLKYRFFIILSKKDDLVAYGFPKIETAKDVVRQMSKKPVFRTRLNSQHVNGSEILVNCAWHYFYQISSPLWAKLT